MIGDRLGKWVIYKELGRGGMGRVYLAQEEIGGRQAALKILAAELAQDVGFLHRFQREIETLSLLDHPNIVRFYESGMENALYFYAMEYVEGQSLEEILHDQVRLPKGRLPWKDVLDIALQVCPALKHVHDHGVIHRDLKPPNLLRTPTGQIKLMDFGIAKVFASSHLTATGGVVGTAEYLSPEQAAGKPVTKRSDLYSLGVVLYTMLTGRTPFEGNSFLDLLHKHRYAQFDRPAKLVPEIPYEIDEIVCQLLEKDPANRPADCLVLGRQLEAVRRKLERKGSSTEAGAPREATVSENKVGTGLEEGGVGPATLMSRLMREELEREKTGGALSRALNSAWVLVPLLLLVVGILVWTFWPPGPETLFERGAALMQSKHLADWETAWRDYLKPLEDGHPDHPYKEQVEKFRKQIEAARNRDAAAAVSEAERFYRQGERLWQEGKTADARRVWKNVTTVFQGIDSEKEWVGRAAKGLAQLDVQAADKERWAPVRAALKRAAALRDEGKMADAEQIWAGIESLYGAEEGSGEILREVQAARGKGKK
jgi:serine/threonine-protein kinase